MDVLFGDAFRWVICIIMSLVFSGMCIHDLYDFVNKL